MDLLERRDLLEVISAENLGVYRASPTRLRTRSIQLNVRRFAAAEELRLGVRRSPDTAEARAE